jgi:hypothetical protein
MSMAFARIPIRGASIRLRGHDFRVLIAISGHANGDGSAYPSLARIAAVAGIDRAKVPASIRNLQGAGLLRVERRRDAHGDWDSSLYEILLD